MAGDSLANTLSFLQSQVTGNRQIPAAPQSFLESARNPNIRNFAPGKEPQFQSPILQMLMGGAGGVNKNTGAGIGDSLALRAMQPQQQQQQGGGGFLQRMFGLGNIGGAMAGRQEELQRILQEAGAN